MKKIFKDIYTVARHKRQKLWPVIKKVYPLVVMAIKANNTKYAVCIDGFDRILRDMVKEDGKQTD